MWAGGGSLPGNDGWIRLVPADAAALLLPPPLDLPTLGGLHESILGTLTSGQALFFRALSDAAASTDDAALVEALWDLVWAGWITNDTLAPLRVPDRSKAGAGRKAASPAAAAPVRATPVSVGPPCRAARARLPSAAAGGSCPIAILRPPDGCMRSPSRCSIATAC